MPPRKAYAQTVVFSRARYVKAFVALHVRDVEGVSAGVPDVPLRLGHMRIVPQLQNVEKGSVSVQSCFDVC